LAAEVSRPLTAKDFKSDVHIDWCPGCGDFAIVSALHQALAQLGVPPHEVAFITGIGCSGKTSHYANAFGAHTIHGRLLPYATGVKLAHPELTVVCAGGDGDGLGIGAGHFVNSGRRNVDMSYMFFNNGVYGLTKGQASPTLKLGAKPKSLPTPNINEGVNPIWLAVASGFTWVGRSYAFDVKHLTRMILESIQHKGFAFLDILQPCPTYNDLNTKDWYGAKEVEDGETGARGPRVYKLEEQDGHDPVVDEPGEVDEKMLRAIELGAEWGDRIPIGVFYKNDLVPTYGDRLEQRIPKYRKEPPARQVVATGDGRTNVDAGALLAPHAI
jgi:2-oxoglutarate ferredoxin oxidoreductase subunit beta